LTEQSSSYQAASESVDACLAICHALSRIGPSAAEEVLGAFEESDSDCTRGLLARAIGRMPKLNEQQIPRLLGMLNERNGICFGGASALKKYGGKEIACGTDEIVKAFMRAESEEARSALKELILKIGASAVPTIKGYLNNQADAEQRTRANELLEEITNGPANGHAK